MNKFTVVLLYPGERHLDMYHVEAQSVQGAIAAAETRANRWDAEDVLVFDEHLKNVASYKEISF